jgi:transposase
MVRLGEGHSTAKLRLMAKGTRTAPASRLMLAPALVLEGAKRAEAAKAGGMDRQALRDWVHRFNAEGPEGLYDKRSQGLALRAD